MQTKNSMTQEIKAAQHSQREHEWLLPSMQSIAKEVNHKAKRYKKVRDENGVQTNVLFGKQDERKSKVSGDKKKLEKMHFY
jgi:hypothetical protein